MKIPFSLAKSQQKMCHNFSQKSNTVWHYPFIQAFTHDIIQQAVKKYPFWEFLPQWTLCCSFWKPGFGIIQRSSTHKEEFHHRLRCNRTYTCENCCFVHRCVAPPFVFKYLLPERFETSSLVLFFFFSHLAKCTVKRQCNVVVRNARGGLCLFWKQTATVKAIKLIKATFLKKEELFTMYQNPSKQWCVPGISWHQYPPKIFMINANYIFKAFLRA